MIIGTVFYELYKNDKLNNYLENDIGKDNIKEIVFQEGVKRIADFPTHLNNLTKVYLPKSLISMEDGDLGTTVSLSFCNYSLNYIEVDDDNEKYYDIDGVLFENRDVYENDVLIKKKCLQDYPVGRKGSYKIPNDTKRIESEAFYEREGLTSVEIPDSVTEIGEYAFSRCSALTNVKLSSNIKKICQGTFFYCKSLSNIEIPEGIVEIIIDEERNKGAFEECTSLKKVVLPDSVTSVANNTFDGCNDMKVYSRVTSFELNNREKVKSILDNQAPTIKLIKDGKKIIIEAKDNEGGIGLAEKPYSTDNINWFSDKEIVLNDNQVSKIYVKDELGNVGNIDISKAVDIAELKEKEKNDPSTNDGNKENQNEKDGNKEFGDKNDQNSNKGNTGDKNSNEGSTGNKNSNKDLTDGKNNNNGTKDTSESPKIFGQYGGKSIAIMALIIIFGTGVVGYKKYKKNNF